MGMTLPPPNNGPLDWAGFDLDTDVAAAAAGLGRGREAAFALPASAFHMHKAKAKDWAERRGIRKFIRPENTAAVVAHLPGADERTHCILRGDFVLCDLIPAIIATRGRCQHLRIATLGLSVGNADTLATLVERGAVARLTLVVSHYFQQVDKATVFRAVAARLSGVASVVITRCHAKVICLPMESGEAFVIEGSANLRSSDNTEQMVIFNDAETLGFHEAWIDSLA